MCANGTGEHVRATPPSTPSHGDSVFVVVVSVRPSRWRALPLPLVVAQLVLCLRYSFFFFAMTGHDDVRRTNKLKSNTG